ncbi:ATP-binding protein [Streptantibioticus ferralitis]|uniref:ATP-binding protein n=1 Tax=Streptantibioticus ferralitis TaxID=236510 RepID=A0ABT5Z453_9ACTN|nr:ATP-binding protein [Streptantibioticus ferralitis]MDF2258608.1 ATP-binding protein [Streptantibioticus ferralitis]
MPEPQPLGTGLAKRLSGILTARGIASDACAHRDDIPGPKAALEAAEARIPPRYRNAMADHPQVTQWIDGLIAAARRGPVGAPDLARGGSLLIAGPTGTGKTYQAYGAVRGLLAAGVRLRWQALTASDLYAAQRPRHGSDSERDLQALMRCPLLIVDDLGAAKTSEWTEELTYRLVNYRYEQLLPTVFTTNLPIRDLREMLGDRVASRLAEMTERVTLTGADRRRQAAA